MDKIKKVIVILVIVIIIIIITLVVLALRRRTEGSDYQDTEFEHDISHEEVTTTIEQVTNRNDYYAIKSIIGKYAYAIVDGGTESLYNMLDENYLSENQITVNNVRDIVDNIDISNMSEEQMNNFQLTVTVNKMLYKETSPNIRTFFTYGNFTNNINEDNVEFQIIVEMDSKNNTFYIYPTSYMKENYSDEEELQAYTSNLTEIPKNDYNKFNFVNIEDSTLLNDYLAKFKNALLEDVDSSYELLDVEYREAKFSNISEYREYVNNNISKLLSITIDKYKRDVTEDGTRYTCVDKNGNYYIFDETAIMQYTLLLDTYTTILPEFSEKYQGADNATKVGMNVEKIIQALNLKDAKYIYNKLDETFKANNFPTIDEFESYINNVYPSTYEIEYSNPTEEQGTFMQPIVLIDKETSQRSENTIIMQLKDNYEFVMSFSVQE